MLFKDREEAGEKLARLLKNKVDKKVVVVSLLRGGVILGEKFSKTLKIFHLPLAAAKIPAPYQPELAIGALCFDYTYLEPDVINSLRLDKISTKRQVDIAKEKFKSYLKRFSLKKSIFKKIVKKTVLLTDDGIATGATVKAALLFLRSFRPKKVILAVPVAPKGFVNPGFDEVIILHFDPVFSAVSQFYKDFPQVEDKEVKEILKKKIS